MIFTRRKQLGRASAAVSSGKSTREAEANFKFLAINSRKGRQKSFRTLVGYRVQPAGSGGRGAMTAGGARGRCAPREKSSCRFGNPVTFANSRVATRPMPGCLHVP